MPNEIGSPYLDLPPLYFRVNGVYMTEEDILRERKWALDELRRLKNETFTLNRQLDAARKTNTVLLEEVQVLHAQLEWYKRTQAYRLDHWLREVGRKFAAAVWRLRDAWEILNGRYSA